jgi:hypothetical protein
LNVSTNYQSFLASRAFSSELAYLNLTARLPACPKSTPGGTPMAAYSKAMEFEGELVEVVRPAGDVGEDVEGALGHDRDAEPHLAHQLDHQPPALAMDRPHAIDGLIALLRQSRDPRPLDERVRADAAVLLHPVDMASLPR